MASRRRPLGISVLTITTNPVSPPAKLVSQIVSVGDPASFSLTPGGSPPFVFQWQLDVTNLPGQTSSSLFLTNAQPTDAGTYCVVVIDASPATNTYCATLQVLNPPAMTIQPTNQTVTAGTSVTFVAAVSSPGTLQWQWRLNGIFINGATTSTLTINNAQLANGGVYDCLVANGVHPVISSNATLNFPIPAFPFADNFANATLTNSYSGLVSGSTLGATREPGEPFDANRPGSNSVWMQWQAPANGVVTFNTRGSPIDTRLASYTGTAVSSLATVAANDDTDGYYFTSQIIYPAVAGTIYDIAVDNLPGDAGAFFLSWSLNTNITLFPAITQQPADLTVGPGGNATFSVQAANTNNLTYQWYFDHSYAIAGGTSAALTISNVALANVGLYSVELTGTNGQSVQSDYALLEIGTPGIVSYAKLEEILLSGGNGFNLNSRGPRPLVFSSVSAGTIGYVGINSYNSYDSSLQAANTKVVGSSGSTRYYALVPTDTATLVMASTNSGCLTTLFVFTGTDVLNMQTVASDENHTAGDGLNGKVSFRAISGTTYLVQVNPSSATAPQQLGVTWKLGVPPTASGPPQTVFLIEGAGTTLLPGAGSPTSPTYQWRCNGGNISSATGSSYPLSNVQYNQGGTYSVVVSNLMGVVTNTIAVLSIESPLRLAPDTSLGPVNYRVTGSATQAVVLQLSTDLTVWTGLFTNFDSTAAINYLDRNAGGRSSGFYRWKRYP